MVKTTRVLFRTETQKTHYYWVPKLKSLVEKFWWEKLLEISAYDTLSSSNDYSALYKKKKKDHVARKIAAKFQLIFGHLVKPTLPMAQIDECLREYDIEDEKKDLLLFKLKPYPVERILNGLSESEDVKILVEDVCRERRNRRKKIAPLVKQLKNLRMDEPFLDFPPLKETIEKFEYLLAFDEEVIKQGKTLHKKIYRDFGLDKAKDISSQKHTFWNQAVPAAVDILNPFHHDDNCRRKCEITHEGALKKVAELLKILYPTIWKEETSTITKRIKQKNYRIIR